MVNENLHFLSWAPRWQQKIFTSSRRLVGTTPGQYVFSLDTFGLRNDLFLGIYCLTTFFWGDFLMTFFWHFFDELFLNKEGRESGALKLPKMIVLGLKIRLLKTNHNL